MKTCIPRSSAALATAKCAGVGTTMVTASDIVEEIVERGVRLTPSSSSTSAARSGLVSANPAEPDSGQVAQNSYVMEAEAPAPTTPTRGVPVKSPLRARSPRRI